MQKIKKLYFKMRNAEAQDKSRKYYHIEYKMSNYLEILQKVRDMRSSVFLI